MKQKLKGKKKAVSKCRFWYPHEIVETQRVTHICSKDNGGSYLKGEGDD